jgi:hypothetical protein
MAIVDACGRPHTGRVRSVASVIVASAVVVASPDIVRADGSLDAFDTLGQALVLGELFIPDVRREVPLGDGEPRWVLSWPIVPTSIPLYEYRDAGKQRGIRLTPFGEPQYRFGAESPGLRFAAGARATWFRNGLMPSLEAGGVAGVDGNGGFIGLGISLLPMEFDGGATFGLVTRLVATDEERRIDLALDLQLPFR